MATDRRIYFCDGLAAVYVDGVLKGSGTKSEAIQKVLDLVGVTLIPSPYFLQGSKSLSNVAPTVAAIDSYEVATLATSRQIFDLRAQGQALLDQAAALQATTNAAAASAVKKA